MIHLAVADYLSSHHTVNIYHKHLKLIMLTALSAPDDSNRGVHNTELMYLYHLYMLYYFIFFSTGCHSVYKPGYASYTSHSWIDPFLSQETAATEDPTSPCQYPIMYMNVRRPFHTYI